LNMEENNSLDIIFEEVKQRRALEFSRIDALEKKISIIIATNLAFFLFLVSRINFTDWPIYQILLGFLSLGLFILSLIFSLRAISVVKYRIDPEIGPLIENYFEKKPNDTKKVLVMNYKETIMQINETGNMKASLTKSAFRFLCVGLVFCVLSILINTIQ